MEPYRGGQDVFYPLQQQSRLSYQQHQQQDYFAQHQQQQQQPYVHRATPAAEQPQPRHPPPQQWAAPPRQQLQQQQRQPRRQPPPPLPLPQPHQQQPSAAAAAPAAAAAAAPPRSTHASAGAAAWLDALQCEVLAFAGRVAPSAAEQAQRDAVFDAFSRLAQQTLGRHAGGRLATVLFGSGGVGLALHSSDLDICLTGLSSPQGDRGDFLPHQKGYVVGCLRDLEAAVRRCGDVLALSRVRLVAHARVPVLKLSLANGLELDVSLNDDNGAKAARFLASFQATYPVLRPLLLVLKTLLKQRNLSEVYLGGLGGWSLANMAIAHLMEEDRAGAQVAHAGAMLLSFLRRYGQLFDTWRDAVAVQRGGIVELLSLPYTFRQGMKMNGVVALEDPLTGREVAGGSHRYADVAALFGRMSSRLDEALEAAAGTAGSSSSSWRQQAADEEEDDDDDGDGWGDAYGYTAAHRSPTRRARALARSNGSSSSSAGGAGDGFALLSLLLDCPSALARTAAAAGGGGGAAAAGQWAWGNGAVAVDAPRKRGRWQR